MTAWIVADYWLVAQGYGGMGVYGSETIVQ